jgi:porin
LQNQLPEPMLLVTLYNANWGFAGVNGPSIQGLAPPGQVPTGTQANGIGLYLALPSPLPVGLDSRVWLSGSLSGPAAINPYPTYLAGGWIGQGLIANRPQDLLILGLAGSSTSADLQPSQPGQMALELSYQLQLSRNFYLQPYSQLQSGVPGQGPLWTIGMQWSWSL